MSEGAAGPPPSERRGPESQGSGAAVLVRGPYGWKAASAGGTAPLGGKYLPTRSLSANQERRCTRCLAAAGGHGSGP